MHKLINAKTCIEHQLKQKIFLPIPIKASPQRFNQRFKTLKHNITGTINER